MEQTVTKTAESKTKRKFSCDLRWTVIFSAVLGAILFIAIYGVRILDPTYDEWLFAGGDLTQHYIGWLYFRETGWHFPLGVTEGLLGSIKTSMVYTDSFPFMAIFFKILSPILPRPFQYYGIMGLMIFMLNGASASLLIHKFNKNPIFCILGSTLFIVSPTVMHRLYGHETLACHFFIILSFCLWAYQDHKWKKKWQNLAMPALLWTLLCVGAVGTHMYFVPMIYFVMLGCLITDIFKYKKMIRPISCFVSSTVFSLITMWVIGAFYGEGDTASYGLGRNSANMNTFWNPFRLNSKVFTGYECDPSKFLLPRAKLDGQYEGYTYLGLGVLIAVFAALLILFSCVERKGKKSKIYFLSVLYNKRIPLIACIVVFVLAMFMAISPVGTFDDKILYTIKYPDSIEKLLATFRASGRFAWVAQYMIYTGILYAFSKISLKKTSVAALAVCLGIQLADISPQIYSRRWYKEYQAHYNILKDARWEKLAKDCDKFYGLPYDQPEKYSYDFAQFAYEHNMTTNHFSVARPPLDDIIHQYYDVINDITNGTADPKALYVFFQPELIPQVEGLKIYEIDGLYVVKCPNQPDPLQ